MNILLINHYAGSNKLGMEFRPYYLAKEWLKMGHKTTIVGATYSHLRRIQPRNPGWETIDNIQYLWLWANKYQGNGIMRLVNMLVFIFQLIISAVYLAVKVRPNVVIASSTYPLDIFPAWLIAKMCKAKLVFEIHDLWPLSPMELGGMSKWHPFIMLMRLGEWFAYKFSDKIISILPHAFDHARLDGVREENFIHIPNGINEEDYANSLALPNKMQKLIDNQKKIFLVGYAGSIGVANAMENLVNAAKLLGMEHVLFLIVGDGPTLLALKKQCADEDITNVLFLGKLEKAAVYTFLKQMDALYVGANKSKLYRFGVSPNKLFDYMMAAKVVIDAIGAKGSVVEKAKCGVAVEPGNAKKLAAAILKLKMTTKSTLEKMGKLGRVYVLKHHTYEHLAMEFFKALV